jgi:hypothetical protein
MAVNIDAGCGRQTRRTPFVFVGNNEYAIDGIGFWRKGAAVVDK